MAIINVTLHRELKTTNIMIISCIILLFVILIIASPIILFIVLLIKLLTSDNKRNTYSGDSYYNYYNKHSSTMTKKLYRSRADRKLAGVCGGIAGYFDIDPTIVRLGFIILAFCFGGGLLAYLIAWIVIPEEPGTFNPQLNQKEEGHDNKGTY